MEKFNEIISYLRRKKGLKQSEMGFLIGKSGATWSDWERGKTEPTFQELSKISEIFRVSTDFLLGLTSENAQLINTDESGKNQQKSTAKCTGNSTANENIESLKIANEPIFEYNKKITESANGKAPNERILRLMSEVFDYMADIEARLTKLEEKRHE